MKRKNIVSGIFLTLTLLTSCAPQNNRPMGTAKKILSIEDVPAREEFKHLNKSERYELYSQIEEIPLASCEEYFANEIKAFLTQYENVELENLTLEKDYLSVVANKNQKSFLNLNFEVNLIIDTSDHVGSNQFAMEISEQLEDFMDQYGYFASKAKQLTIHSFDLYHTKFYDSSGTYSIMNESMFIEQPEDEYAIQTIAFNFTKTNPDFILRKFGTIPESKELYVEYSVKDDYFVDKNLESRIADLQEAGNDVKEYLLSPKRTKDFVSSKGITLLTVSFYSGNMDDSYLTFNFELDKATGNAFLPTP